MKGKIRMKKSEDGSFFAVKTTKLVGEEGAAYVEQKKEETKKKRAERNKAKKSGRRQKQPSRVKASRADGAYEIEIREKKKFIERVTGYGMFLLPV